MTWAELRRVLGGKLKAIKKPGGKHDLWFVECDSKRVGEVLDSHGQGEMRNRELRRLTLVGYWPISYPPHERRTGH